MKLTIQNMNKVINTAEVKSLVSSYLLQKVFADTIREDVNKVYKDVLIEIPIYEDLRESKTQIFDVKYTYLSKDEESMTRIYAEVDKRLRAMKIKPDSMSLDFCPALCAEDDLRKTERLIADTTGTPFGCDADSLLCSKDGLENYHKWINLVVSAIISLPGFENPLKKIIATI